MAIVGDLALSADNGVLPPTDLPTISNPTPYRGPKEIVSLAQKICLVSPKCVVAWAGPLDAAGTTLRRLREHAVARTLTQSDLGEWVAGFDAHEQKLELLMTLVRSQPDDRFIADRFAFRCGHAVDRGPYDQLMVAGSGGEKVATHAREAARPLRLHFRADGVPAKADEASFRALNIWATMWAMEVATGHGLAWPLNTGGGYEIASWNGRTHSFEKLSNVTLVFSFANLTSGGISPPFRVIHLRYDESNTLEIVSAFRPRSPALDESAWSLGAYSIPDATADGMMKKIKLGADEVVCRFASSSPVIWVVACHDDGVYRSPILRVATADETGFVWEASQMGLRIRASASVVDEMNTQLRDLRLLRAGRGS